MSDISERLNRAYQRREAKLLAMQAIGFAVARTPSYYRRSRVFYRAAFWQPSNPRHAYVPAPAPMMRLVGCVTPDFDRWRGDTVFWEYAPHEHCLGWHTHPDGIVSRGGDGLCWGEVYLLPSRKRHHNLLVAGYRVGGCDDGVTIDFGTTFEVESEETVKTSEGVLPAARHADSMAQEIAEEMRVESEREDEDDDEDEDT